MDYSCTFINKPIYYTGTANGGGVVLRAGQAWDWNTALNNLYECGLWQMLIACIDL